MRSRTCSITEGCFLIVDTHILLWFLVAPERLPARVRADLAEGETAPVFSVISIWEIALKAAAGKLPEQLEPDGIRNILVLAGWTELPFTGEHAVATRSLPMIHSDPFDRALVAQAQCERTTLLTADKLLGGYGTAVSVIKPHKGD